MTEPPSSPPPKRLRRILWFNLACDLDDPALGFATGWIHEVAGHCEHIDVITLRKGRVLEQENVSIHPLGKGRGFGRPRMAVEFYRHLGRLLRENQYEAAFGHMATQSVVLSFPALRLQGIPIVLWYAHPRADLRLRLADAAAARVVTCLQASYPLGQEKVEVIGHGIDTRRFRPGPLPESTVPTILCAGRISRAKRLHRLILAAHEMSRLSARRFKVVILGSPLTSADRVYAREIQTQVDSLHLKEVIEFHPAVLWETMPGWYRRCCLHVNLAPVGFADKVVFEAMSCARPSVVANQGFRETLGPYADQLTLGSGDSQEWAEKLDALLALEDEEMESLGLYLRERVLSLHDLGRFATRLADLCAALAHPQGGLGA